MPIDPSIPLSVQPVRFNDPFAILQQYQDSRQKREYQEQQMRSQQALEEERRQRTEREQQAAKKQAQDDDALANIYKEAFDKTSGTLKLDLFGQLATERGMGAALQELMPKLTASEKTLLDIRKAKDEAFRGAAKDIVASDFHPVIVKGILQQLESHGNDVSMFRELQQKPEEFRSALTKFAAGPQAPAAPYTLTPGQQRRGPDNEIIAENPIAPKPPDVPADYTLGNQRFSGQTNRPVATGQSDSTADERNKIWIQRNGQPLFVLPNQVQPGDAPFDRSRVSGRPMLSSDANRVSDFDDALDLLSELGPEIKGTGASSWLGSMVPTAVTDVTGLGMNAKVRQAIIDKAKQIIGKTLEGGVLRKEDEAKYTKILPTIADPPELAASKIEGLQKTVQRQRENLLGSLSDAGYDVERSQNRASKAASYPPGTLIRMMAPNGQVKQVKPEDVERYKAAGAKVIGAGQ